MPAHRPAYALPARNTLGCCGAQLELYGDERKQYQLPSEYTIERAPTLVGAPASVALFEPINPRVKNDAKRIAVSCCCCCCCVWCVVCVELGDHGFVCRPTTHTRVRSTWLTPRAA